MIRIHDLETNKIVDREMNADELAQWETYKANAQAQSNAETTKATIKAELLAKLGITADEAALLLS